MRKAVPLYRTVLVVLSILGWGFTSTVHAMEFAIVGPRAAGMGGAGVAVTTDSLATYWNPAGLAMSQTVDPRVQGSAQIIDRLGVIDTVKHIHDLDKNNAANIPQAQALANRLNQPGASVSGIGAGGVYFKGYWGNSAFGFNVSDVATSGGFLKTPISVAQNGSSFQVNGQFAVRGLEARQAAFSYAYAFADRTFAIGATVKAIQGAAYTGLLDVNKANESDNIKDSFGRAKLSTAVSVDVGAVFRPTSWLRVGVVGKDLTAPTFDAPDGSQFQLGPQARAGIAVNPDSSLTLTFDGDITSNRTLVPGLKSRVLSVGAEQTILGDFLAIRIGALKNVEDAKSTFTPTAGFGIRFFALRVDIGGGYDFRERQALASGSISMTF
ncbi:MAG TPA: conjugal transfer protein TraF [Nitrospiraceae bacterium]|nr:conjugal transfer protein TraF [Nitrospiraceae bacterium]